MVASHPKLILSLRHLLHRLFRRLRRPRTGQRRVLGERGAAASRLRTRRPALGLARRGGLGREAFARFGGASAFPRDRETNDRTGCVKRLAKHKICGSLWITATR